MAPSSVRLRFLISERVGGRSAPQINTFLKSFFHRGTNYHCEEILALLYKFDTNWAQKFKEFVAKNDEIKSGISSCYAVRNSIAHGGTQSLGPKILKQYFENSLALIVQLEILLRK